jgi:hypothetical protein
VTAKGTEFLSFGDENILKLDCSDGCQTVYLKNLVSYIL